MNPKQVGVCDLPKLSFGSSRTDMRPTVRIYPLTREQLLAFGVSESAIGDLQCMDVERESLNDQDKGDLSMENNPMEVQLNDLPVLPFEKILSYLSLQDRILSRAVLRRWCWTVDSFKTKHLCFSDRPRDLSKRRVDWFAAHSPRTSSPNSDSAHSPRRSPPRSCQTSSISVSADSMFAKWTHYRSLIPSTRLLSSCRN